MITRRTKVQLLIFVVITLLGVSFVGARYARLDEKVRDTSYEVTAHFAEAGGIFAGAEVTYRGVGIGTVDRLKLTEAGVDVVLKIDNKWDDIPADSIAAVGNRSAVGEQFVELQPKVDKGDVLEQGSEIQLVDTRTPIATETLLADLSTTVSSVDQDALRTTVDELGKAFNGTGDDLQQIIDTGTSFIDAADANFDITTKLIEDGNTVLNTQIDSESSLRTFANQLALFSGTLADADPDLRRLIDNGSFAANQLRTFIEDNRIELSSLLNNLVTTGEIFVDHLDGLNQVLVIYPYIVEGGFTVVSKSPGTGKFDAHFGLVLSTTEPCLEGYEGTVRRPPNERFTDPGMNVNAKCTEPATKTNARGAQNLPRSATSFARPDAFFDPDTRKVTYADETDPDPVAPWESGGTVAPRSLGKESWKWLYLEPMTGQ
ncbi:MCE family protein [Nocardioides sp.]|uniref:MCE family protein n=1 Tax=Nocardioides sp. TaxID=35761 RepID=UPI00271E02D5|nr:MlaD family protein [Nocardioides sp.]MDO9456325.1 MlaD family protein [Nocardioides sp.]